MNKQKTDLVLGSPPYPTSIIIMSLVTSSSLMIKTADPLPFFDGLVFAIFVTI